MQRYNHRGRTYNVLAQFEGPDRQVGAKEYMRTHLHTRVLCDVDGVVTIASDRDFGLPADPPDSEFGTKGWTSLYHQPTSQPEDDSQA